MQIWQRTEAPFPRAQGTRDPPQSHLLEYDINIKSWQCYGVLFWKGCPQNQVKKAELWIIKIVKSEFIIYPKTWLAIKHIFKVINQTRSLLSIQMCPKLKHPFLALGVPKINSTSLDCPRITSEFITKVVVLLWILKWFCISLTCENNRKLNLGPKNADRFIFCDVTINVYSSMMQSWVLLMRSLEFTIKFEKQKYDLKRVQHHAWRSISKNITKEHYEQLTHKN